MTELRPAAELVTHIETHYRCVAAGPMAAVPLCNPQLSVRLLGLVDWDGVRLGALVMPWAINLLVLPGSEPWLPAPALSKQCWRFPSGDYDFIHADDVGFGPFQMCSLFSPVLEFESMEAACATAQAALLALLRPPLEALVEQAAAEPVSRRRWLFGRGGTAAA